jgi:hypothetical protein
MRAAVRSRALSGQGASNDCGFGPNEEQSFQGARELGRIVFTGGIKPAIDWFGIESRLQDISALRPHSAVTLPSVDLADDPEQHAPQVIATFSHPDICHAITAASRSS